MNKTKKKSLGTFLLNAPYVVWALIFIIVPLIMVFFYAFTEVVSYYDVTLTAQDGTVYSYEIDYTDGSVLAVNGVRTSVKPNQEGSGINSAKACELALEAAGLPSETTEAEATLFTRNGEFTLTHLSGIWTPAVRRAFLLSFFYSLIATVIALIIAYPFAYFLSKTSMKSQRVQMLLIMLPMWMNMLIRTYSWMNILEKNGLINKLLGMLNLGPVPLLGTGGAVVLGMVYNYLPYMILPIYTIMTKISPSLLEAAEDLGCNGFQKLVRLILPLSLPGVISGVIMVFVPSISTFYISQKMSNGTIKLVGDLIETKIKEQWASGGLNAGASMALVLMVVILVCTFIMNRFADNDEGSMPL